MTVRRGNTFEWLVECQQRYADRDDKDIVSISVGEFRALVQRGFDMMEFADQLEVAQIEVQRLEKLCTE